MIRLAFFAALLVSVFAGCRFFGTPRQDSQSYAYLKKHIEAVDCDNGRRAISAKKLLDAPGAPSEIVEYENVSNIVLSIDGSTADSVIVGAHFDKTTLGCGAIDNWTGVVLLARLAHELRDKDNRKSYKFVAFGGEERDLLGSRAMADAISANPKTKPCAMVNLDSFGFEKAWGLESISDRSMLMLAADVERERGGSFSIRDYRGASSDSRSFQRIGVPSITISGLDDDWREYLHREADQVRNMDFGMVAENYAFVRSFIRKLDTVPCESLSAEKS